MSDLDKYWVGNNFFDFYFRRKATWILWATVLFGGAFGVGVLFHVMPNEKPGEFWMLVEAIVILVLGLGAIFSVFDSWSSRARRKKRNQMLEKARRGDPISAKYATAGLYDRIRNSFDPDHVLTVKTKLGNYEMKVSELPDNRVNLPSLKELFSGE